MSRAERDETTGATARPWIGDPLMGCIYGSDGKTVCTVPPDNPFGSPGGMQIRADRVQTIVRAVNAHEALVEACEAAIALTRDLQLAFNSPEWEARERISAAIRLARGDE